LKNDLNPTNGVMLYIWEQNLNNDWMFC
jgi:hypothetical protein